MKVIQVVTTSGKIVEEFSDGSFIETNRANGNKTVVGKIAHDKYLERLQNERGGKKIHFV